MASTVGKLIKVTFSESFPLSLIDGFLESNFLEMGTVYQQDDRRVLYVRPKSEKYSLLIEQLTVWEHEGALSFIEETR